MCEAEHGCAVCIHPGEYLMNGARIYLPHKSVLRAAAEAQQSGQAVEGVKALSPLAGSIPVDYMHAVLEGVVRMLMKLWFHSSHHHEPQYIRRSCHQMAQR